MTAAAPPPRVAAFFDFDRTLLHGDAGVIFGWSLIEWGYEQGKRFPMGSRELRDHNLEITWNAAQTIAKGSAYKALNALGILKRSKLVELTYTFLEGFPATEMSGQMERVWNERLRERLYPRMMEILDEHRKAGHRIVIVSTGMRELIEHSRKALGEDVEVIGVEMRVREGRYNGEVEGPLYGVHKARAVRDYAKKNGIDLASSYAYSDHYSDAAFLAAVGHPVCVNPAMRLRLLAKKRGWGVMHVLPPAQFADEPLPADEKD